MSIYDIGKYYDENMNEIDTKDMITTHLHIPSTPFENQWSGGEDGVPQRYAGSFAMPKTIEAHLFMQGFDYLDYQLLRDYLYGIFGFGKPFYVVDKKQPGKRHKVVLESSFMPERLSRTAGTAVIPFITAESSYAESIGTTQDIERNGINAEDELWGFGMGLIDDPDSFIYTQTNKTEFKIYNAGNADIHPFEQDLKIDIKITGIVLGDDYFQLKNETTGDVFRFDSPNINQNVVLDGPNVSSGGLQFYRNTNRQFITLAPGWNEFTVSGQPIATIAFDFRFYYI